MNEKIQKPIGARDQEKVDVIINCTCSYFSIDPAILYMPGRSNSVVRRICFYLISKNTDLTTPQIAKMLGRNRSQASRGIEIIKVQSGFYASLMHQIKDVAEMCNKFEPKQFEWLIQH